MVCGNCGKESQDGSVACVYCGTQIGLPPPVHQPPYAVPTPRSMSPMVVGAIIVAAGGCMICPIFASILFPIFAGARNAAVQTVRLSKIKQVALGTLMYADDYDDLFPYVRRAESAVQLMSPYIKDPKVFEPTINGSRFDFNLNVGGVKTMTILEPSQIPTWIESLPDPNKRFGVGLVDGGAKMIGPIGRSSIMKAANQRFDRPKESKPLPIDYMIGGPR